MFKGFVKKLILLASVAALICSVACGGESSSTQESVGGSSSNIVENSSSSSVDESSSVSMATYVVEYYFESETEIGVYTKDETLTFSYTTAVGTLLKPDKINLPKYELNEGKSSAVEGILPAEGITFSYYYKIRTYSVEFLSNGGSFVETQWIRHGGKATKPENPTHSNPEAKFHGWLTENNQAYDFDSVVEDNIVLKADWEVPQYGPIV